MELCIDRWSCHNSQWTHSSNRWIHKSNGNYQHENETLNHFRDDIRGTKTMENYKSLMLNKEQNKKTAWDFMVFT